VTDDEHPDRPARATEPVRVARFELLGQAEPDAAVADFDGLGPATAGRARVAEFDGLDADGGRPLAPVIRLDTVAGRRAPGVRRSLDESPGEGESDAGDDAPRRRRRPGTDARQPRTSRQPVEAEPSDNGGVADDSRPGGPAADDIPPDGPLPRGRRRRARPGRLGPDAPDPELPLADADPVAIAREICLRLLTDRARTRQELAHALSRKGVPEEAAAVVLDRFAEVGLVDDAAFAGQWVRSRHTHRGLGRRAIAVELRRKGVADGVAKEALAEVDPESEDRRARELVDRKLRSTTVDTPEQRTKAAQRLVGMLARKGYGAGTAYRVVREALAEHGADADELGPGADLDG